VLAARFRPGSADVVRLGSSYGGWWVPRWVTGRPGLAYCAGAGEDITFDLALLSQGWTVRTFDPTPRAVAHVEATAPASDRFTFDPVGWWASATTLDFFAPANPAYVSHSVNNVHGTSVSFAAAVKPVHQIASEYGDRRVDLIKMDIEGAEHAVISTLVEHGPLPEVLCVEFDQPRPLFRLLATIRLLRGHGYRVIRTEGWNYTFVRRSA